MLLKKQYIVIKQKKLTILYKINGELPLKLSPQTKKPAPKGERVFIFSDG